MLRRVHFPERLHDDVAGIRLVILFDFAGFILRVQGTSPYQ